MWRQCQKAPFSSDIYIFGRLPRKVCTHHIFHHLLKSLVYRVLIANIHNLGGCPCPRCSIPKLRFQDVATKNDMLQRTILARRDTAERREKIFSACQLIYEEQYVIDTAQVEALLKPESLVPTVVCFETLRSSQISYHRCRECIFGKAWSNRF